MKPHTHTVTVRTNCTCPQAEFSHQCPSSEVGVGGIRLAMVWVSGLKVCLIPCNRVTKPLRDS